MTTPRTDLYLDDFKPGDRFEGRGYTFTESEIIDFALRYDPQPIHIDVEAAKAGPFGGLIASGFQSLAITFRLIYQTGWFSSASLGGPGMDNLRWHKPVRPGDTLRAFADVKEVRPSKSKPDRGLLIYELSAVNQSGETVMTATLMSFLKRRRDP
ncbi:MAG: MaoC family dehydratase [Alphaproteobacteria bacterium]|nr:MaoC family dehydratase [Alphaproteobacteria bacterium]